MDDCDQEPDELECGLCEWRGDITDLEECEYGRGGLTWWCPMCGEQQTD